MNDNAAIKPIASDVKKELKTFLARYGSDANRVALYLERMHAAGAFDLNTMKTQQLKKACIEAQLTMRDQDNEPQPFSSRISVPRSVIELLKTDDRDAQDALEQDPLPAPAGFLTLKKRASAKRGR